MSDLTHSLVSTEWLAEHLKDDDLVVLDASRHLPAAERNPRAEFEAAHIPGSRFLDLASLTDSASEVPAALPNPAQLSEKLASLGAALDSLFVLYDDSAVKTAARAWFAFKAHGIANVAILDGGLAKWRSEGRALESGHGSTTKASSSPLPDTIGVMSKADILANIDSCVAQVIDARGADRVFGSGIDPVHGGQNGRIPGSLNLPFGKVLAQDGTFKSPADLRAAFEGAGVDLNAPIIATCGSGVTASVLLFALHLAGHRGARLYDGSWQEWEADPATPKAQGPA